MDRISRTINRNDIILTNIQVLKEKKNALDYFDEPEMEDYSTINKINWIDTFNNINELIAVYKKKNGLPLEYVVRTSDEIPPGEDDPETSYPSPEEDMARRAPHFHEV
eukprot:12112020-Ditylum_brightwellii.AAC.2